MIARKIYLALPVLDESENLESLFDSLLKQDIPFSKLVVCVNNYESWWQHPDKVEACEDNQRSLSFLRSFNKFDIQLIDKCSKGMGWPDKKGGVGWARKVTMDSINEMADDEDMIVSIDADTYYPVNFLSAILDSFQKQNNIYGLALPYYHQLAGDRTDRLILRYEIYMRHYLLNMLRIDNPYAFTALGSAMTFPVWAYRKVGGLTPVKSGEDFYFLQKLIKNGKISIWADTVAYPSSRFSDRVLFGTGPALIKGDNNDWDSYPAYDFKNFNKVGETYQLFTQLYHQDVPTPMDDFLKSQFKTNDLWGSIRSNYKDEVNFVRACKSKIDGLRILQYLRTEQLKSEISNEKNLQNWSKEFWSRDDQPLNQVDLRNLNFNSSPLSLLIELRDFLFTKEQEYRLASARK